MSDADAYKNLSVEDLAMLCAFKDRTIEILQDAAKYHKELALVRVSLSTYCDVRFDGESSVVREYTYLTGGLDLKTGDRVIVPVGRSHHEARATVMSVYNRNTDLDTSIVYKTVHRKDNTNV